MSKNEFPPIFKDDEFNISIDFDGVIHDNNKGWHDGSCYGDPINGSLESIKDLADKYKIIVFTAKAKSDRPLVNGMTGKELVEKWLDKNGFSPYIHSVTSEKPRAKVYIDDKGYRFSNWLDALNFVKRLDD